MKKVRFVSPVRQIKLPTMHDSECHSPRPFIQKEVKFTPHVEYLDYSQVPFTNDPVKRFECGNSSPYPIVNKTSLSNLTKLNNRWKPSNELDLSFLDSSPRKPVEMPKKCTDNRFDKKTLQNRVQANPLSERHYPNVLSSTPNNNGHDAYPQQNDFFLRRDNLKLGSELTKLHLNKENYPLLKKQEIMMIGPLTKPLRNVDGVVSNKPTNDMEIYCSCHHCNKICKSKQQLECTRAEVIQNQNLCSKACNVSHCIKMTPQHAHCSCNIQHLDAYIPNCSCQNIQPALSPTNAVDKKTWAIEKYELNKNSDLDIEKCNNLTASNRATVADLFQIIKMQSEQLQMLQDKVDKFISANKNDEQRVNPPIQNIVTEQMALKSVEAEQKISIGVMTSFEVVRTSTIINKEFVKQTEAQIQCNRSQISIKEVVSKQPVNVNFLDGITPRLQQSESCEPIKSTHFLNNDTKNTEFHEDKTYNEMSLYNVQVDNATPNMSPEQSLYLDIRDYSDSDASSDDQSNVGWTYYNKVMTHVNGILHESDMPSSASALHRDLKNRCIQMQVDKSNVSVAKRVTFGDDPVGLHKPYLQAPSTDTSLKMNQLAAKYLKNAPIVSNTPSPKPTMMPVDMSLATRNYMEKHRIIKGVTQAAQPQINNIPKFLDITALKQQPKFL